MTNRSTTRLSAACAALTIGLFASAGAVLADTAIRHVITQRGREFRPGTISIHKGEVLEFYNDDDGGIVHHAYVDGPDFSFDSGDQKPGDKTDVTFDKSGSFSVLCAIHPKMELKVNVQ